jgi:hypothetical protein
MLHCNIASLRCVMDDVDVLADRCQGPQDLCNPDGEGEWAGVKPVLADPTGVGVRRGRCVRRPSFLGRRVDIVGDNVAWERGRGLLLICGFYPVIDHPFLKRHYVFGDDMSAPANDATKHGCGVAETSQPTQMRQLCSGRMNQPEIW